MSEIVCLFVCVKCEKEREKERDSEREGKGCVGLLFEMSAGDGFM